MRMRAAAAAGGASAGRSEPNVKRANRWRPQARLSSKTGTLSDPTKTAFKPRRRRR